MRRTLQQVRYRWQVIAITIIVNFFVLLASLSRSHHRAHWIGSRRVPRRLHRAIVLALLVGEVALLDTQDFVSVLLMGGITLAIFVALYMSYELIVRHWIY